MILKVHGSMKKNGKDVALEVTELVNEDAIHSQIQSREDHFLECERWGDYDYFIG